MLRQGGIQDRDRDTSKGGRGKTKDHRENRKDLPPPVLVLPKPEEPKPEL